MEVRGVRGLRVWAYFGFGFEFVFGFIFGFGFGFGFGFVHVSGFGFEFGVFDLGETFIKDAINDYALIMNKIIRN
jgi:hypothetical protein